MLKYKYYVVGFKSATPMKIDRDSTARLKKN